MLVLSGPNQAIVSGDILLRAVLRSDLTPMPMTAEVWVRDDESIRADWDDGQLIKVGRDGDEFTIIKDGDDRRAGMRSGTRDIAALKSTAFLTSCLPIVRPLQKSVIREKTSFGEVYRASGCRPRLGDDVPLPRFSCFAGYTPSMFMPTLLQEEAAAVLYRGGRLSFARLGDLFTQQPKATLPEAADRSESSSLLEQLNVPFGYSFGDDGGAVVGRRESGRVAAYWPRTSARVLNNLSKVLVRRRVVESDFSPDVLGGDLLIVGETPLVVITAAHVWDATSGSGAQQYSRFWVGALT